MLNIFSVRLHCEYVIYTILGNDTYERNLQVLIQLLIRMEIEFNTLLHRA
jgi:hypothetical protein